MLTETETRYRLEDIIPDDNLQAMPQSAVKLLEVSRNEEAGPNDFAAPIQSDPGLAVQVLKFVNSSFFGFSRKISSIPLAINLVGMKTIKNFTLWNALYSVTPTPTCDVFVLKSLWQDSLRRAVFGRLFAQYLRLDSAEEVFAGALMQDMAVPLLINSHPEQYAEMLQECQASGVRLSQLETETFGFDHAAVGAYCCTKWNFPTSLVDMIGNHTRMTSSFPTSDANQVLTVCSLLPSVSFATWPEKARLKKCIRKLLPETDAEQLLKKTDEEFIQLAPSLDMDSSCRTLVDWFREEDQV